MGGWPSIGRAVLVGIAAVFAARGALAQALPADRLYVGTCYQPVDRTPAQVHEDVRRMRAAGFTVVRMGDLSWDYFEPREGQFDFAPFDAVMEEMRANGIGVILDIPGLPAPAWLHRHYPGVDLVAADGARRPAAERYMEDISDPDYRRLAKRMAEALLRRYAHHPALLAVGYDNEIGNGFISYSAADRQRFIAWLQRKYGTLGALNQAWATQRWSRRIGDWQEIELPDADGPGPFERQLDLRRYWSEVTIATLADLEALRRRIVPDKPAISNLWDSSPRKGFDYLSSYRGYVTHGAMGFYPSEPVAASFEALMMKGALDTPLWFNEFTAGGGGYYGTPGRSRMWAYVGLIDGVQGILAWTFNSHLGGEEQALFGLLNHDDSPSWKLAEFATIAGEFARLQQLGFPRHPRPQVAIAYSFESRLASSPNGPSNTVRQYVTTPYLDQEHAAFAPLFDANIDVAVINVGHEDLSRYRLVILPGDYLLDGASAQALRDYVATGGNVLMTAFSAKVDEHDQWFAVPLPGRLHDVFGLRTNEFYDTQAPLQVDFGDAQVTTSSRFYELLEPTTALPLASLANLPGRPPALTRNAYGKGHAYYLATPADRAVLGAFYRRILPALGVDRGPDTPPGVYAREVDGRVLYVNTTTTGQRVPIAARRHGLLSDRWFTGDIQLAPYAVELAE